MEISYFFCVSRFQHAVDFCIHMWKSSFAGKIQGSIYALQHYVLGEDSIIILANTVLLEMIIVDNSLHSYVLLCKAGMMCFREHQMDIIGVLRLLSLRTTI